MNITETSRKDEVITAACELVDQQEAVIKDLMGKKNTLTFLLIILFITHILFWTLKTEWRRSRQSRKVLSSPASPASPILGKTISSIPLYIYIYSF